jgi:RNA exonuclease 4
MGIQIRDLAKYAKYKNEHGQTMSLKNLSIKYLNKQIQSGSHSSIIDARAALALYRINEKDWENQVK